MKNNDESCGGFGKTGYGEPVSSTTPLLSEGLEVFPNTDVDPFWRERAELFIAGVSEHLKQAEAEEQPVLGGDASEQKGANA